ncbi:glycoside hydrolase family 127 protein [Occultella kanbiaonis]|uniref:glycoside hydrolase family 127 protein n=1 Tax=Occultella kanbiaonis TaxID=2675754 RepID=UPI0013D3F5E3|nr:beta-L-arabinofuranosidase domain-containing protein [Occultella kanbiaonis]
MSVSSSPQARPAPSPATLRSAGAGPVDPVAATALRPLPLGAIRLTSGFLADLERENGQVSVTRGHDHLERERAWDNFTHAAAREQASPHAGPVFEDGEAFKWLEAVAWEVGHRDDPDLGRWLTEYADLVRRAQADDGYLSTFNQAAGKRGRYEWISYDHEIFNMATMIQAGVAQYRTTGSTVLLDVARRAADHLDTTFGWGKREETCGHPLVEMALVELYRVTRERRYLDLATYFVEVRGRGSLTDPTWQGWTSVYFSDRIGVRETAYPEGHAVRAVYFASGATDVALENGDTALLAALRRQWDNMVEAKMYVNGSLGSRWEGEAFGDPYELPTDRGYGETCAAIASLQWSWRLLIATGEAKYADLIERQFYNAVLSGVSLDHDKYFYVNALQVRDGALAYDSRMAASGRHEWFGCSCCPTNLMRTLATISQYVATATDGGVQIHQFAAAQIDGDGLAVRVATGYPWDGDVVVEVTGADGRERELAIRVPPWARGAELDVDGVAVPVDAGTYARLRRFWNTGQRLTLRLPMTPRTEHGHHRVDAVRGAVALWRGPLLYTIEHVDQAPGVLVDDVVMVGANLRVEHRDVLGGVPAVVLDGRAAPDGPAVDIVAIPYFMWANREIGPMKVWLPVAP